MLSRVSSAATLIALLCCLASPALADQEVKDPGVRGGFENTAGMLQFRGIAIPHPPAIGPNGKNAITANERASFLEGIIRAGKLEATCESCAQVTDGSPALGKGELDPIFPQFTTNSNGLGARHNADQCFLCHAQPTLGGSGGFLVPNPGPDARPMPPENPLFRLVPHRFGKQNVVPSFEEQFGPIREVRFKYNPDGTRDGSVHQLWVVTGMDPGADPTIPHCRIVQPDFAAELARGNLAFRIPIQMYGMGLIDAIQDREILARHDATAAQRKRLGIAGHPNRSGNDNTVMRFGWKAQNKSISMFAGEAYNVEMGITNELFPTPTEEDSDCSGPEKPALSDVTRTDEDDEHNEAFTNPLHILADWMQFTLLMRFMDAPQPDPNPSFSARRGRDIFASIGCALCHTPQMQTAPTTSSAVLEDRPVNLFSDLLVHHMGAGLADDIVQGSAGPDEFRSAPLWGVGQRLFFLHDGRTSDLVAAIEAHRSPATKKFPASEANAVIDNFDRLLGPDRQAVIDFLRSL
jgi:di-heme oxidoreductase (putative peroxidase)